MKSNKQIERDAMTLLRKWRACPRYIFGSSGGIYEGIDPERVRIAYDTVEF